MIVCLLLIGFAGLLTGFFSSGMYDTMAGKLFNPYVIIGSIFFGLVGYYMDARINRKKTIHLKYV